MELEINKILESTIKTAGEDFINEFKDRTLTNIAKEQKELEPTTADMKAKYLQESRKIIKQYGDVYQVKNSQIYHYKISNEYPEYVSNTTLNDGYYVMDKNENLICKDDVTLSINNSLENLRKEIVNEESSFLNNCRRENEEYIVDEIGDDSKYVFLTRECDGMQFQEFNISDELYNDLLNDKSDEIKLKYANGEYVRN